MKQLKQQIVDELLGSIACADNGAWADCAQHAAGAAGLALKALVESGDRSVAGFIELALEALARHRGQLAGALFEAMRREGGRE
jgi:hypothetical protein